MIDYLAFQDTGKILEFDKDMTVVKDNFIPHYTFGYIPFHGLTNKPYPTGKTIPFGTCSIAVLLEKGETPDDWLIFYDRKRFDAKTWTPLLGNLALNSGALFTQLGPMKNVSFYHDVFVKPSCDLKLFAGMIVPAGQTIGEALGDRQQDSRLSNDETILVNRVIEGIQTEFRCFVVNNEIVASSVYKRGNKLKAEATTDHEKKILLYSLNNIKRTCPEAIPHHTYVVDFADFDDGNYYSVIEFNCLNCSGKYACDRLAIFRALMELE